MKYAVLAPVGANVTADPQWITEFARHVEACGFESIVAVDHPVVIADYKSRYPYDPSGRFELAEDCDIPDPIDLLAFIAARTNVLGLATGVLILPHHHPVILAKRVATLDRLSGGRVRLCVGVGWMSEETEACGIDFASRGRRADESIDAMRALWAGSAPGGGTHKGEFFAFAGALSFPKPARASGVPVHIGGHSPAAARRAGLRGDGFQPLGLPKADLMNRIALMRSTAERAGRDPGLLEITLGHHVGRITGSRAADLAELGAHRILLSPTPTADLERVKDEMSACAERLGIAPLTRMANRA
ncbi:LLM class F420-dependent oxidoreductase [Trebonia kvetii]|uniref:LLM class F420-dependent oxidoreductase n=1 Tax=Trebonia kvetii TaxID=2480626 RepID=A0A6P2BY59_9ACTN|nr:LLM class F420-dependent oxidoreductase [Trebonia kvetii]TVZ02123.1 LLM class F420-dependent oxidoreductase [Trebonia kvetii]